MAILGGFLALSLGTYLVWPSRYNVLAHLSVGFFPVAYLIPVAVVGVHRDFPGEIVERYAAVVALGGAFYVVGLAAGAAVPTLARLRIPYAFVALPTPWFEARTLLLLKWLAWAALLGIGVSYAVMGFVPAFAENPLVAKFFRGEYQEPYQRVAVLFRLSYFTLATLIPVLLAAWYVTRRRSMLVYAVLGALAIALTLTRGTVLAGALTFLGLLVAARHGRVAFAAYIGFLVLVYSLGSAVFYLIYLALDMQVGGFYETETIWHVIGSGAPDVQDQLLFLRAYVDQGQPWTYGKTFIGGLIPGNFPWNPSVWSLEVVNPKAAIADIGSGGLRLPAPIMGYTAFGWTGALIVPCLSGFIMGRVMRFTRRFVRGDPLLQSAVALNLSATLGVQVSQFYWLSMYALVSAAVAGVLAYHIVWRPLQVLGASRSGRTPATPGASNPPPALLGQRR
jgi:hypothetical protein